MGCTAMFQMQQLKQCNKIKTTNDYDCPFNQQMNENRLKSRCFSQRLCCGRRVDLTHSKDWHSWRRAGGSGSSLKNASGCSQPRTAGTGCQMLHPPGRHKHSLSFSIMLHLLIVTVALRWNDWDEVLILGHGCSSTCAAGNLCPNIHLQHRSDQCLRKNCISRVALITL